MLSQKKEYFDNPLQYNYYLANPDSKVMFPELNKDLSLSNLTNTTQKIILLKGRVANYIEMVFSQCPAADKDGYFIEATDENNQIIPNTVQKYNSIAFSSFIRDILSMGVTSQGLKHTLLSKLTEQIQTVKHSYSMDKEYKKNLGGN